MKAERNKDRYAHLNYGPISKLGTVVHPKYGWIITVADDDNKFRMLTGEHIPPCGKPKYNPVFNNARTV